MENPAVQTETNAGDATPSTELAERILRRRTEPLGVIDVWQGQRQFARTAGWVAQRFALLDHWKTRYGGNEDTAAPGASLVFAGPGRSGVEPAHTLSNSIQTAHAVNRADPPQPGAAPAVSTAPPGLFRIRRRSAAPASSLQGASSPEARINSRAPADGDNAASGVSSSSEVVARSQTERGASRAVEIPAITPHAAPSAPDLILPRSPGLGVKTAPETAGEASRDVEYPIHRKATSSPAAITTTGAPAGAAGVSRQHSETSSATATAPVQTPVRVSRIEATPEKLPLRLQRKPGDDATGLERTRELTGTPAPQAIARMPLSDSSTYSSSAHSSLESQSFAGGEGAASVAERIGPAGIGTSHTRGESSTSLTLIQRRSVGVASASEAAPAGAGNQPAPAFAEIRGASPQQADLHAGGARQPAMILRRSVERSSMSGGAPGVATAATRTALPLAISAAPGSVPQAARQATTAESTSSMSPESAAPATSAPAAAANEVDVARLAEQVSRLLARQLAVERERRGRGGWR